ncbi:MAG: response regulator [Rhizobacter sp.]|nr:response regulator [Chlorobiales bacterium]
MPEEKSPASALPATPALSGLMPAVPLNSSAASPDPNSPTSSATSLELRRLLADAVKSRDHALEALQAKSRLLADMSHEIRTPMNAIIGLAGLLLGTPLSGDQQELASLVHRSAQSLLGILNNVLDLSKIEAGKLELEQMEFSPLLVAEGAIELTAAAAGEKNLSLVSYIDPAIPLTLRGDPNRLRQVLLNLLSNAVKFTEQGDVKLTIELTEPPQHNGRAEMIAVKFSVCDTGIGLSDGARQRLFEPFVQTVKSPAHKQSGTGLGLAICRQLIALMGGRIEVESTERKGTDVFFTLPFRRSAFAAEPLKSLAPLAGLDLIVAGSHPAQREALERYVKAWGMNAIGVATIADVLVALRHAATATVFVDVVLIDHALVRTESQQEILHLILSQPAAPQLILITPNRSSAPETSAPESLDMSLFAAVLRGKPVKQSQLLGALSTAVPHRPLRPLKSSGQATVQTFANPSSSPREEQPEIKLESSSGILLNKASLTGLNGERESSIVLIAEDNIINQKLLALLLRRFGVTSESVATGRGAAEAIRTRRYAMILMDCLMPEMNGYDATRTIRKLEQASGLHTPVVAITARTAEQDLNRCLAAGMDDYMQKPVEPLRLYEILKRWMPALYPLMPPEEAFPQLQLSPSLPAPLQGVPEIASPDETPIHFDRLQRLAGRNRKAIEELLHIFVFSTRAGLSDIAVAMGRRDKSALMFAAHSLKGSSANVGADEMAMLALRLEQAGEIENWDYAWVVYNLLEQAFSRASACIDEL